MANPIAGKALSDIEIEEMLARKALDRSMFSRLLPLLRPIRKHIFAVIGIELLLVFTVFMRPWFVRQLLDHGLIQQDDHWLLDERLVLWLGLGLALSWLGRFMLAGVSQYVAGAQRLAGARLCPCTRLECQLFRPNQGRANHFPRRP